MLLSCGLFLRLLKLLKLAVCKLDLSSEGTGRVCFFRYQIFNNSDFIVQFGESMICRCLLG